MPPNWYELARWLTEFTELPDRLKRMELIMAADRDLLAQIATDLTALNPTLASLIASEKALRARVVELEGQAAADEVGDLAAADAVKAAFDGVAGQFTAEPSVPDVEPLPRAGRPSAFELSPPAPRGDRACGVRTSG